MNRMPSPLNRTTVLGLDKVCAPWFWGLRTNGLWLKPSPIQQNRTSQITYMPFMWPGHEEPVWRILGIHYETHDDMVTLDHRSRQLRDEDISGVNQHAHIRLIYRRYSLLVP